MTMKRLSTILILTAIALLRPTDAAVAQVAGSTTLGVAVAEARDVAIGWSASRTILGHTVYNDKNEKVGNIDDIIITPRNSVSYVIIGAGGFVGLGRHDVAIPVSQIRLQNGKVVLPGATKDAVKSLPQFEYASK
jgi:sporulation protein YlmC with PRC-barrel domain